MCCPLVSTVLNLDSTTDFGIFCLIWYFIYFSCSSFASSLCSTKHPPFIKTKNLKMLKSIYTTYLHSFLHYLHICLFITGTVPSLCDEYLDCWVSWPMADSKVVHLLLFSCKRKCFFVQLFGQPASSQLLHSCSYPLPVYLWIHTLHTPVNCYDVKLDVYYLIILIW